MNVEFEIICNEAIVAMLKIFLNIKVWEFVTTAQDIIHHPVFI
jgi:hypothetical protein